MAQKRGRFLIDSSSGGVAIKVIPRTLAENAGLDEIDILIELRRAHKKGNKNDGVDVFTGKITNMVTNNVVEPLRVGTQEITSATEAATMILRIDDVIASKSPPVAKRRRPGHPLPSEKGRTP